MASLWKGSDLSRMGKLWVILLAAVSVAVLAEPGDTDDAVRSEIAGLVDKLGHHSPKVRDEATERLLDLGPAAITALKEAAAADDLETTLRAKALLAVFDQLLFAGAAVELEVSADRIDWDDSVDLMVRVRNPSPYPVHLPFDRADRDETASERPARQVGDLLDVAEYLQVLAPNGDPVSLRVDDILQDDEVRAAVRVRVDDPPLTDLEPGGTHVHRVVGFNRGWARYPLLHSGAYRIQLVYQPQWSDDKLTGAQVGRVESNVVSITVGSPAPEVVRLARAPARLQLERRDDSVVLSLQNLDDLAVWVNVWLDPRECPPAARVAWSVQCGDAMEELGLAIPAGGADEEGFSRSKLVELDPGSAVELQRFPLSAAAGAARCPGSSGPDQSVAIRASYTNLTSFAWQREHAASLLGDPRAPEALRTPLPKRMLTTSLHSSSLPLKGVE